MSRKPLARVRWAAWGLLLLAAAVFGTVAPPTLSAPPYVDVNAGTTTLLSGVHVFDAALGLDTDTLMNVSLALDATVGAVSVPDRTGILAYFESLGRLSLVVPAPGIDDVLTRVLLTVAPLAPTGAALLTVSASTIAPWEERSGTVSAGIALRVGECFAPPTLASPAALAVDEDAVLLVAGIVVGSCVPLHEFRFVAAASVGVVTVNGSALPLVAPLRAIAAVLGAARGVVFTPPPDWNSGNGRGAVVLTFLLADASAPDRTPGASATTAVSVLAVNDAPAVAGPARLAAAEDGSVSLSGIAFTDSDCTEMWGCALTVEARVGHGTLAVDPSQAQIVPCAGQTGDDVRAVFVRAPGIRHVCVRGRPDAVTSALGRGAYSPDAGWYGNDSLNLVVTDGGAMGLGGPRNASRIIPIVVSSVNSPPTIAAPIALLVTPEDTPLAITGVVVADVELGSKGIIHVVLTPAIGRLALGTTSYWVKIAPALPGAARVLDFSGPVDDVNVALAGLTYTPAPGWNSVLGGADTITIAVDDGGGVAQGAGGMRVASATLHVRGLPVNDAPTVVVPAALSTDEDTAVDFQVVVGDVDASDYAAPFVSVLLTLDSASCVALSPAAGTLLSASLRDATLAPGARGCYVSPVSITGLVADVNIVLFAASYVPAPNWAGSDTLRFTVTDCVDSSGAATALSLAVLSQTTVLVASVNDAPVLTAPMWLSVAEDGVLAVPGVALADVDLNAGGMDHVLSVEVACDHGLVSVGGAEVVGVRFATDGVAPGAGGRVSAPVLTFAGTLTGVNAALASLRYAPNSNFVGSDRLRITASDGGWSGAGGVRVGTASVGLSVVEVNDAPVVVVTKEARTVAANASAVAAGVSVFDADAAGTISPVLMSFQVTTTVGCVSLTDERDSAPIFVPSPDIVAMLHFDTGARSVPSPSIAVRGALLRINAALETLRVFGPQSPECGGAGDGAFSPVDPRMTLHFVVSDGAGSTTADVVVQITAANDPPVVFVVAPVGGISTNEDAPVALGTIFAVRDRDIGTGTLSLLVASTYGCVSASAVADVVVMATVARDSCPSGSAAALNVTCGMNGATAFVSSLVYAPASHWTSTVRGLDEVSLSASDGASSARGAVAVLVLPVDPTPQVLVASAPAVAVAECTGGGDIYLDAFTIVDPAAASRAAVGERRASFVATIAASAGAVRLRSYAGLAITDAVSAMSGAALTASDVVQLQPFLAQVTLTGTAAAITAAIAPLNFLATTCSAGSALVAVDVANAAAPDNAASGSVSITVEFAYQGPVLTAPSTVLGVENTLLAFPAAVLVLGKFTDAVQVTLTASFGELSLASPVAGLVVTSTNSRGLAFKGGPSAVSAALASIVYAPPQDYASSIAGADVVEMSATDISVGVVGGTVGAGLPQSSSCTITVIIANIASPPVLVPAVSSISVVEDAAYPLAGVLSLSDADGDDQIVNIDITAASGSILTGPPFGAVVVATETRAGQPVPISDLLQGGGPDAAVPLAHFAFYATVESARSVLNGLSYIGAPEWSGVDVVTIVVVDGAGLSATSTLDVVIAAANDPPTVSAPFVVASNESDCVDVSGVTFADDDVGTGAVFVTLLANHGTFSVDMSAAADTAQLLTQQPSNNVTFVGSFGAAVALLGTLRYCGDEFYNGIDTASVTAGDWRLAGVGSLLSASTEFDIVISPVNDPPAVTAPPSLSVVTGVETRVAGVSLFDPDVSEPQLAPGPSAGIFSVVVSAIGGAVRMEQFGGVLVSPAGVYNSSVALMGLPGAVNAALATLFFLSVTTAPSLTPESITIVADDLGNSGGPANIVTAVVAVSRTARLPVPLVSAPAMLNGTEDVGMGLPGFFISLPPDAPASSELVDVELRTLLGTIALDAATAPAVLVLADARVHGSVEDALAMPRDGPSLVRDWSTLQLRGLVADVNAAIAGAVYTPRPNANGLWAPVGPFVAGRLPPPVRDAVSVLAVVSRLREGSDTSPINGLAPVVGSARTLMSIEWVNDAPTIAAPVSVLVSGSAASSLRGVSVDDVDVGEVLDGRLSVSIACAGGKVSFDSIALLTAGFVPDVLSVPASSQLLVGSPRRLNAALAALTYTPAESLSVQDTVAVAVNDLGNCGLGGPKHANVTVLVTLTPAVGPPTLTHSEPPPTVPENANVALTGLYVSYRGFDARAVTATVSVNAGSLLAASRDDVAVSARSGALQAVVASTPLTAFVPEEQTLLLAAPTVSEVQSVTTSGTVGTINGTFRLVIAGESSPSILAAETAPGMLSKLQSMTRAGQYISSVTVRLVSSVVHSYQWNVTFASSAGNIGPVSVISSLGSGFHVAVSTATKGAAPGGTFALRFGGAATGAIAWNAPGSAVASALNLLSTVFSVNVSRSTVAGGFVWTVTFAPSLGGTPSNDGDLALLVVDATNLQGSLTAAELIKGVSPMAGGFVLGAGGVQTVPLRIDASADEVAAAVSAMSVFSAGDVAVSRAAIQESATYGFIWTVNLWAGAPALSADAVDLTPASAKVYCGEWLSAGTLTGSPAALTALLSEAFVAPLPYFNSLTGGYLSVSFVLADAAPATGGNPGSSHSSYRVFVSSTPSSPLMTLPVGPLVATENTPLEVPGLAIADLDNATAATPATALSLVVAAGLGAVAFAPAGGVTVTSGVAARGSAAFPMSLIAAASLSWSTVTLVGHGDALAGALAGAVYHPLPHWSLATATPGPVDEVQVITVDGGPPRDVDVVALEVSSGIVSGGTFVLHLAIVGSGTASTAALPYNVSASAMNAALAALSNVPPSSSIFVAKGATDADGAVTWSITTTNGLGNSTLSVTSSVVAHCVGTCPVAPQMSVARLRSASDRISGTWALQIGAAAPAQLAVDATALDVAMALAGSRAVDVSRSQVTDAGGYAWSVTFALELDVRNACGQPLLAVSDAGLVGYGANAAVARQVAGSCAKDTISLAATTLGAPTSRGSVSVVVLPSPSPPVVSIDRPFAYTRSLEDDVVELPMFFIDGVGSGADRVFALYVTSTAGGGVSFGAPALSGIAVVDGCALASEEPAATACIGGSIVALNAALRRLLFAPLPHANGYFDVSVTAYAASVSATGAVVGAGAGSTRTWGVILEAVNDAPTVIAPAELAVVTGTPALVLGVAVADVDAADAGGDGLVDVTVSCDACVLSLPARERLSVHYIDGVVASAAGGPRISFSASVTRANAALAGLRCLVPRGRAGLHDAITVAVTDRGNVGLGGVKTATAQIALVVTSDNPPPVVTAPSARYSGSEDAALVLSGIVLTDDFAPDRGTSAYSLALSASFGALTVTPDPAISVGPGGERGGLLVRGTLAGVAAAARTLQYIPAANWAGLDDVLITLTAARGSVGVGAARVYIAQVNDGPLVSPAALDASITAAGSLSLAAFSVSDVDASFDPDLTLDVTVSCTAGHLVVQAPWRRLSEDLRDATAAAIGNRRALAPFGLQLSADAPADPKVVTFAGAVRHVNSALAAMVFAAPARWRGTATVTISATDAGGLTAVSTFTVVVTMPHVPPSVTPCRSPPIVVSEDSEVALPALAIDNPNADAATRAITVTVMTEGGVITFGDAPPAGAVSVATERGAAPGSAITTLTGLGADLAAALAALVLVPPTNFVGRIRVFAAADDAPHAPRSLLEWTQSLDVALVTVDFMPINDSPVVTTGDGAIAATQDMPAALSGIELDDADVRQGAIDMILVVSSATQGAAVAASGFVGAVMLTGNATAALNATGSLRALRAFVQSGALVVVPGAGFVGTVAVHVVLTDSDGASGAGDITVAFANVADGPILTFPAVASAFWSEMAEDSGSVALPVVLLTDLDAALHAASPATLHIACSHGTIGAPVALIPRILVVSASSVGSAPASAAAFTDAVLSAADADAATLLASLLYTPAPNYNGVDQVTIAVVRDVLPSDTRIPTRTVYGVPTGPLGGSLWVRVTAVNDAPAIVAPGEVAGTEDTPVRVADIGLSDADAGDAFVSGAWELSVALDSGAKAVVRPTGGFAVASGDPLGGSSAWSLIGQLSFLQAAVTTLRVIPADDFAGTATLSLLLNDRGVVGAGGALVAEATVSVVFAAVDDPPVVLLDTAVRRGSPLVRSLGYAAATVVTTQGTALALGTSAVAGGGGSGGDGSIVVVVADRDAPSDAVFTVRLALRDPDSLVELPAPSPAIRVLSSGSNVLVFQGVESDVNGALANVLISVAASAAGEVLSFGVIDEYAPLSADAWGSAFVAGAVAWPARLSPRSTGSVRLAVSLVNHAPVLAISSGFAVDEDATRALGGAVTVADVDMEDAVGARDGVLSVVVAAARGVLTMPLVPGVWITGVTTDRAVQSLAVVREPFFSYGNALLPNGGVGTTVSFRCSVAACNAALAALQYTGPLYYYGPDAITVSVDDGGYTGVGGALQDSGVLAVTVAPVDNAPVITAPTAITSVEDTDVALSVLTFDGFRVDDVDIGSGVLTVTLRVGNGVLVLSHVDGLRFIVGGPSGGPELSFVGLLEDVNVALQFLVYRAAEHYNGLDVLAVSVSDGTLTSRASVPVVVEAVDVPPVVTVPSVDVGMNEDEVLTLGRAGVDVDDVRTVPPKDITVAVRVAHAGALAVQTITTSTAVVNDVQQVSVSGTGLHGTFTLTLSRGNGASATTAPIQWNATARTSEELVGGMNGAGPGQSLESRLAALRSFVGLSVDASRSAAAPNVRWTVTFYGAESSLPLMRVSGAGLGVTSGSAVAQVIPLVNGTSVGGTFTLSALDAVTPPLPCATTARAMKQALEALPTVGTVDVTRTGPDLNLGFVWTVAFFAPAGPPPLLRANSSGLSGAGAAASVALVSPPLGWVSVGAITTMALHVNEVQRVASNATSGSLTGGFALSLNFTTWGDGAPSVTTAAINWNAVGNIADESLTHALGSNFGESVQSRLQAAFAAAAAATAPGPVAQDLAAMTVHVTRAGPWAHGSYAWYVTFYGARARLPLLSLASSTLQTAGSPTVLTSVFWPENLLGGTFTVTIGDSTTPPLATTTTAAALRTALLALPSLADPVTTVGDVLVTRNEESHEGGYTWLVAFTQASLVWQDALLVDSSALTGVGAAAYTTIVASAPAPDVLSLGTMAGVVMLRDELTMRPGGEDSTHGTDAFGRQYGSSVGTTHGALIFRGAVPRVRAALQSVRYAPPQGWFGAAVVSVAASDGAAGTALSWVTRTFSVNVASVSDIPRLVTPSMFQAVENADLVLSGVMIADGDPRSAVMSVRLWTARGTLSVYKGTPGPNVTLVGTIAEINGALATLRYRSLLYVNGLDAVGVHMTDGAGGVTHAVVRVFVAAENNKPYVHILSGSPQPMQGGTSLAVTGVSVTDPDVDEYLSVSTVSALTNMMDVSVMPRFGVVTFGAPFAGVSVWPGTLTPAAAAHVDDDAALYEAGALVNVTLTPAADAQARVVLLRGGLASLNALLATMIFTPDADFYGLAAVRLVADDNGNTGLGGVLTDTSLVVLNVSYVNHLTHVNVPAAPLPVDEDAEVAIGVTLSDRDDAHELAMGHREPTVAVAVQAEFGTLSLDIPMPFGVTLSLGDGTRDPALVFSGAFRVVSAALALVRYRSAQNWNTGRHGFDFVHVSADDGGYGFVVGPDGLLTPNRTARDVSVTRDPSIAVLVMNVVAVNDAPVLSMPQQVLDPVLHTGDSLSPIVDSLTTFAVTEDVPVSLIGTGLRDVDSAEVLDGLLLVTVSSGHGLVSLNRGTRAPVAAYLIGTGTRDTTVSFRATASDANAALTGLVYVGVQDYFGPDAVTIRVDDLGNTGKLAHGPRNTGANGVVLLTQATATSCYDQLTLPVFVAAVNDAPVIHVPRTLVLVEEDTRFPIPLYVTDPDDMYGNNTMRVTLSSVHGLWTLYDVPQNVTFLVGDGIDDKTLTLQGPLGAVNVALDSAEYLSDLHYNSFRADPDHITVTANDEGNYGSGGVNIVTVVFDVNVRPVNDPPLLLVPGGTVVYEQRDVYRVGAVSVFTLDEEVPTVMPGIGVIDVDAAERVEGTIVVTVACGHCTFRPASDVGVRVIPGRDASGGFTLYLRGAIGAINAALLNASYTGDKNYFGTDAVVINVNDEGNNGAGGALNVTDTIPVVVLPVNDAPVWVLPRTAVLAIEDKGHVLAGLRVFDADAAVLQQTMNVTVCVAHGGITLAGESSDLVITNGTGTLDRCVTFHAGLNGTNAALDGSVYTPLHNYNTFSGRDSLALYVSDGFATDVTTLFVERVAGVNDAPVVHLPNEQRIGYPCNETDTDPEDTRCGWLLSVPLVTLVEGVTTPLVGISVSDVDIDESPRSVADMELSTYMGGVLALPVTAGLVLHDGVASGQRLRFAGSLARVNAALGALTYTGAQYYNGPDNVTVLVNDNGYTGYGGPLWSSGTLPIFVTAVNNPIVLTMPQGSFVATEDGHELHVLGISLADVDVDGGEVEVDIVCTHGEVSVIRVPGLQFTYSVRPGDTNTTFVSPAPEIELLDGALAPGEVPMSGGVTPLATLQSEFSSHVHFRGTLADANSALAGLKYMPTPNWNSAGKNADYVTISVSDLGNSGAGGPTTDSGSFVVTVLPVNDAPVITVPGALRSPNVVTGDGLSRVIVGAVPLVTDEDTVLAIRGVHVRDIDVDDGATGALLVTLSALHGTLSVTYHDATVSAHPLETSVLGNDLTGLVFIAGDGRDDATMSFMGPIRLVNMALARISYTPPRNGYGGDAITILVNDQGFTGAGGPKSDLQVLEVVILAVNDPPVIAVPRSPDGTNLHTVDEGKSVRLWGVTVSPDDFLTADIDDPYLMPLYESGAEMWLTLGSQPDVAGATHLQDTVANPPSEALGETWRLSLVADLYPGPAGSAPHELTPMPDGRMYFSADDGLTGRELWVSPDGTGPALALVKDAYPGPTGSNPLFLTPFGGALFFSAVGIDTNWMLRTDACGGMRLSTIRITPAVAANLDSVRAVRATPWVPPAPAPDVGPPVQSFQYGASASVQVMYAVSASATWARGSTYDCPVGYHWASTAEGQLLFTVTHAGGAAYETSGAVPDYAEFVYFDECGWDGYTFEGVDRFSFRFADSHITGALKYAGGRDGDVVVLDNFATAGFAGLVCIAGQDVVCDGGATACIAGTGRELWVSAANGTSNTTGRVADIRPGAWGSNPTHIVALPDRIVFAAFTDAFGNELWCSDGTAAGTRLVADVYPGWESSEPRDLAVVNTTVFFSATDGVRGEELWRSDGLPSGGMAGTQLVADIRVGGAGSRPRGLIAFGGLLLFRADDGVHGVELWASDGTPAGTHMVLDIWPGAGSSVPMDLTPFGGLVYFAASDGTTGVEPWVTDGTSAGTHQLRDIALGVASSNPSRFAAFSPRPSVPTRLFFVVTAAPSASLVDHSQLWVTSGTSATTVRAFDLTAPEFDLDDTASVARPAALVAFNGGLFFSASRGDANVMRPRGGTYNALDAQGGVAPGVQSGLVRQSIAVYDVDALTTPLIFSLECRKCTLSLSMDQVVAPLDPAAVWAGGLAFSQGNGTGYSSIVFTATLRDANLAFRDIIYTPQPLQNGEDRVVITVNDTGARGFYGAVNVVQNDVDIWIRAVNTPPSVSLPASNSLTAIRGLPLPLAGVSVFDPDSKETSRTDANGIVHFAPMRVAVSVSAGRLTAGVTSGLSITGTAVASPGFSVTGAMDDVNRALAGLWYVCKDSDACTAGAHVLSVTVDDLGHTGLGGPLQATAEMLLTVVDGN